VPDTLPDVEIETPLPRAVQIKFRALNAVRWENGSAKKGLWSNIYSAVVP
jgi:hypothetical protein